MIFSLSVSLSHSLSPTQHPLLLRRFTYLSFFFAPPLLPFSVSPFNFFYSPHLNCEVALINQFFSFALKLDMLCLEKNTIFVLILIFNLLSYFIILHNKNTWKLLLLHFLILINQICKTNLNGPAYYEKVANGNENSCCREKLESSNNRHLVSKRLTMDILRFDLW